MGLLGSTFSYQRVFFWRLSGCLFSLWMVSCSSEKNLSENPVPISPQRKGSDVINTGPSGETSSKKNPVSPSKLIEIPTTDCLIEITRSSQTLDGSEKNGAIITLLNNEQFKDALLVYRLPGSLVSNGSLIAVSDMVFGSNGTHGTGAYQLEIHAAEQKNCKLNISVSEDDAQSKHNITVKASLPQ